MTNSSGKKFIWYRDIPIWIAAIASGVIAYYAIYSFSPLVENLDLRNRNRELTENNKNLEQGIEGIRREKINLTSEINLLDKRIKTEEKILNNLNNENQKLNTRNDKLTKSLTELSGNLGDMFERQRKLDKRNEKLEAETQKLIEKRSKLQIRSDKLNRQLTKMNAKLNDANIELKRIKNERDGMWRLNRRYILEQIKTKVIAITTIHDMKSVFGAYWPTEYYRDYWGARVEFAGDWGHSLTPNIDKLKAGKELILSQLDSQIFNLLLETHRIEFQDKIRSFVKKHNKILSQNIKENRKIFNLHIISSDIVFRTYGSKYYHKGTKNKEKVSKQEIKKEKMNTN